MPNSPCNYICFIFPDMFDGTIVSQGDNVEAIVDVEEDETKTYGPVQ